MDGQTDRQTDRGVCVEVRRQPWVLFFRHHPLPDFMTLLLAWNPVIRLGWPSHRALGSILLFLPSAGITSVHCSIIVSFNLCPGGQMQVTMLAWEIHHDWGGGSCVTSESHQGKGVVGISEMSIKSLRSVIRKIWYSLSPFCILTGSLAPERFKEHWAWSYFLQLVLGGGCGWSSEGQANLCC